MKQAKHFRRLWGLMLLLIAMLMPQGVWAASHYDAGYDNTETTYSADGIKFKVVYLRMYNYQGNNSHFSNNPLVTITAGGHTHTFHLGDLCGESGNRIFYYNGEGNEDPYKGSGRFSKKTYKQTVDGIPVTAYFDNQRNDKSVSGSGNGGSSKWCTADLTIEIGVQTDATVNISGQWRDWSDGVNTNSENYSWNFSIDKHTCNSDTESTASTYIKHNATCTAAAVYYKSCSWCGEAQSDIFTSGNALGHSISGGKCSRCSHGFIYYTSTNNAVVTPKRANFGTSVDVVDNTYSNGQGVIETSAPVTQIGDECFYHKNALKSIQIPATVTSIGRYAFTSCTGLTGTLVIPDAVTSIGNDAFELCSTLSGVTFGSSLQSIGEYAFTSCSKLSGTLTLPASLTTIGKAAFQYCSGFTGNLTIPNKVTTIGEDAFDSCSGLTGTLTLPASVTTLQAYSFSKCPFTTVRLEKNSMYAWANYVFDGLSSKGTLLVPSNLVKTYQANKYWLGAFKTITCITHNIQSVAQKAASCTVDGNTAHYKCSGCDALFTNSAGTATTTLAAVTVKATGHGKTKKYAASYAWEGNASDPTCTFTLKCLDCQADVVNQPLYTTAGTYGSFSATTTPAKCAEKGVVTCQAAGKYTDPNGKNAPYTETTTSNATNTTTYAIAAFGHGHKGYTPSYAWIGTADDPTCTFTLFCEECKTNVVNEVLTTDAAAANGFYAQTAHVDEGCTDAGYTTYAATGKYPATSPSVAYTEQTPNVKTYGITAHGHDYADAVWTWADDGHSATCSRTCEYCGDEQKADVNLEGGISSEETQHATCTTKGVHTYTATATVKDKTYTDVKEVDDIEALDHLFGEGSWEWANDESGCEALCIVVCEREGCGARMSNSAIFGRGLTAEVTTPPTCTTKGVHTYTAIAVMSGAKRTDVREFEDIPALGHGHQGYTPSYAWTGTAADPICKFRLFCEDCQTAVVDEELILGLEAAGGYYTQTDHYDATCTDRGSTTYAAMGQYDAEAPSVVYTEEHPDIHTYEISALGHNYADAVWTWADDGHSATCSLTCSVCSDEQHADVTLGNGITSEVVTPATCAAAGSTLYNAIVTVKDVDYISTKMVDGDVAALPHTFADNDTRHELCTVCHHTLFHYTSSRANSPVWINSSNKNYDADDNVLKVVSNTCDADRHGVIEFDGTLVRIGQYGFSGSLFAGTLVIPSTVTTIDQFAFTGDDSFTSVEFGPNLTTIGQFAFSDCSSLTGTIVIPDAVTSVGLSAFYNCNINNLVARCQLDLRSCGVYEYQITRTHEFTEESRDHLAQAATCQKDATYYITCANCHKPGTETWTDEDSKGAHTFADNDTRHELCTTCGHTLFHYTFEPGTPPMIMPGPSARFLDPEGNSLEIVSFSNPDDIDSGESYMEFDGELATIGESAFLHSMFEGSYIIPSTVTTIGDAAFADNRNVKGIELGASVTTIGVGAFADCSSITGPLTIPASVTEMGYNAFSGCGNVETFVVSCTSPLTTEDLRNACIPDEKLEIRHADDSEKTLVSAATCRNDAVYHLVCSACGLDDNITEPHTATGLHTFADDDINHELCTTCGMSFAPTIFYYTVEPGADPVNPTFPENLLDYVGRPLTIVSNTVDEEGNGVMEFDGPLVTIGEYAFLGAPFIGSLTIPASVTTIGEYAFCNCQYLAGNVKLPATVTTIGGKAFSYCDRVKSFYVLCTSPLRQNDLDDAGIEEEKVAHYHADESNMTLVQASTCTKDAIYHIVCGACGVEEDAPVLGTATGHTFADDDINHEVCTTCGMSFAPTIFYYTVEPGADPVDPTFPENLLDDVGRPLTIVSNTVDEEGNGIMEFDGPLVTIGENAFSGAPFIGSLTIPASVTTIGNFAFTRCKGLTGLKLGAAVTTIGEYAFYNCQYLAGNVKLPATVTTIGGKAFFNCNRVKSFYVLCTSPLTQDDLDNAGIEEEKVAHYHADESNMTLVQASTCTTDAIYHIVCDACGVEEDAPALGTATGHTFADDDINHELCTTCGMSFAPTIFYYTVEPGADHVDPNCPENLLDDVGRPLTIVRNNVDKEGNGVMEFDGPLVTIGENAFTGAPFIGSLTIPASVATIGELAFASCSGLTGTLTIPDAVTTIGVGAFAYCENLTGLEIGASVATIGDYAFSDCTNLTGTLTIPDAVTTIGNYAFSNCHDLTDLKLGASVTTIGCYAFSRCYGLTGTLTIPDAVTTIEEDAFSICSGLTGLKLGAAVTTIGEYAFYYCNGLTGTLTIPDAVTTIGNYAFSNCSGLTGLKLGAAVTTIGEEAFYNCRDLAGNVKLPDTVTTIGNDAFFNCDRVKSFYVLCTSPLTQDDLDIAGIEEEKVAHYHADESNMTLVQAPTCTTDAIYHIVCGACGVEEDAPVLGTATGHTFADDDINHELCTTCGMSFAHTIFYYTVEPGAGPVNPTFPENLLDDVGNPLTIVRNTVDEEGNGVMEFDGTLVTIGESAFWLAPLIGSLTIPASVTTIGEHAFESCYHLAGLNLGAAVTTIGDGAFSDCYDLTGLKLGASVTTIGEYAFNRCYRLTGTLTIPDAVTEIGEGAFFYCDHLTGLKLGAAVTTIGEYAFSDCEYLAGNVKLPATVTEIGASAFSDCNRVKSFYVLCTSPLTQDDLDNAGIEEEKVAHYHADESNMTLVQASTCATDAIYHIVCGACGVEEDAPVLGTATGLHTFADDDINHELCTTCGMSFTHTTFYYTVKPGAAPVNPYWPENLLDAVGNPLTIVSNTVDKEGNGIMKFNGTLVTIGESAFEYCYGLIGSLTIPSTVTTIGDYAFYGCDGLTGTLTIPASVTTVGEGVFCYADFENCLTPCTLDLEYSGLNPEIITYLHHYDEHSYCSICGRFDIPSEPSIGTLVRFINFLQQPEAETSGYSTSYVKDIAARILGHETAVWNPEKMLKTDIKIRTGAVYIETNVKQLPTAESQDVQMLDDEGLLWAVLDNNADLHIVTSMPKIKMKSCHGLFSNISTTNYIYGLEHLDLQDVTDMSDMFAGCNALQEVDLYDLYAPNVTNTSRMFYGCERIEYIDLEGCLTMTGVTEKADMFTGCGTMATDSDGDPYVTFVNVGWSPDEITATKEGTGWDDNYMLICDPM